MTQSANQNRRGLIRSMPDGALAIATAIGLSGLTAVALLASAQWKIGLLCANLSAFGAWGIFDRSVIRPRWLQILARAGSALVAGASAFALLYIAIEFALGNLKR